MNWLSFILDITLIGLLSTGIFFAIKLSQQLATMRESRSEMEAFVLDFSRTVSRAENGIQGLKTMARSSGDDLEKLIDQGKALRDELGFLIDSADQIAERLTTAATQATRHAPPSPSKETVTPPCTTRPTTKTHAEALASLTGTKDSLVSSKAEKELLAALKKLG